MARLLAMAARDARLVQGQGQGAQTCQADNGHYGVELLGPIVGWGLKVQTSFDQQHRGTGKE